MKQTKLLIIAIFFLAISEINADRTAVVSSTELNNPCQTDFDPNSTQITFYGDSLGDLVDSPLYGYFGWEWYLTVHDTSVRWDIQNLAVSGNRTRNVYDLIKNCSDSDQKRKNFKTADNIALEIGGNDYIDHVAMLYYMPWKFGDVDARITYNTRVIVRALRNSLRNKRVLVMGNFPVISKSPILGEMGDYFVWGKYLPNGQIINKNEEYQEALLHNQIGHDLQESLKDLLSGLTQVYDSLVLFISPVLGAELTRVFLAQPEVNSKTGKDLWYWKHLAEWQKTPFSLVSIGMMFHQLSLIRMVDEENTSEDIYEYKENDVVKGTTYYHSGRVKFISLYGLFSFSLDAYFHRFYVADPVLFSDPIHLNHIGYYHWAKQITPQFKSMGWDKLPAPATYGGETCRTWNCGKAEKPPFGDEIKDNLKPEPVILPPSDIDWILLICLFTGKCW